uniref:Uncharacterized protein n=1 Tax=Cucumis melo TaxID=3656 RepID=A0A9I9EH95_CUCME
MSFFFHVSTSILDGLCSFSSGVTELLEIVFSNSRRQKRMVMIANAPVIHEVEIKYKMNIVPLAIRTLMASLFGIVPNCFDI